MKKVKDHLEDTGERMVPAYHKSHMIYGEHITRYHAAASVVRGKIVLDIASGSGYGSALLAKTAKRVYGVDLDKQAVRYANENYEANNITFLEGDGTHIPIESNKVDVVVSFETIEHIKDYKSFLAEVRRVLRDDGLLIISTPNDLEFSEGNHFHIHEFERKELEALLSKYFSTTKAYYQGTWLYNALLDERLLSSEWEAPRLTLQTAPIKLDKCIYFYFLCANRPINETIEPLGTISEHYSERDRQTYEISARKHMDDQAAVMNHLENQLKTTESELHKVSSELHAIYNSKRWRLTTGIAKFKPHNK